MEFPFLYTDDIDANSDFSETFDMFEYLYWVGLEPNVLMTLTEIQFSETFDLVDPFEVSWIFFSDLTK